MQLDAIASRKGDRSPAMPPTRSAWFTFDWPWPGSSVRVALGGHELLEARCHHFLAVAAVSTAWPSVAPALAHAGAGVREGRVHHLAACWQRPPTQVCAIAQSASVVHEFRQAPSAQVKGVQSCVVLGGQAPWPSQVAAPCNIVLLTQVAGRHTVAVEANVHCPPTQSPVMPQGGCAVQTLPQAPQFWGSVCVSKPLSITPSQSSSRPLHSSDCAVTWPAHAFPQVPSGWHVWVPATQIPTPGDPGPVKHGWVLPGTQTTQFPFPSQTVPPFWPQAVPAGSGGLLQPARSQTSAVQSLPSAQFRVPTPHWPPAQVATWQGSFGDPQSAGDVHGGAAQTPLAQTVPASQE
jgi:hypothetical protein